MKLLDSGTPYSLCTCPNPEHLTHQDLPHGTVEHPNPCGPAPSQDTLLTVDLLPSATPYSPWTFPTEDIEQHTDIAT